MILGIDSELTMQGNNSVMHVEVSRNVEAFTADVVGRELAAVIEATMRAYFDLLLQNVNKAEAIEIMQEATKNATLDFIQFLREEDEADRASKN